MKVNMIKPIYLKRCTQVQLYQIAYLAWDNCNTYLAQFARRMSKYTPEYVEENKNQILEAELLPDEKAYVRKLERMQTKLLQQSIKVMTTFHKLKKHIIEAFSPTDIHKEMKEAGLSYLSKVESQDIKMALDMLNIMIEYIEKNMDILTREGKMPSSFYNDIINLKKNFNDLNGDYIVTKDKSAVATKNKIAANNQVFTDLVTMLTDSKLSYIDPEDRKQFTITQLKMQIERAGMGDLKGTITDASNGRPIPNVEIEVLSLGINTFTNSKGGYHLRYLVSGNYKLLLKAPSLPDTKAYLPLEILINIEKKVLKTQDIQMTPMPENKSS